MYPSTCQKRSHGLWVHSSWFFYCWYSHTYGKNAQNLDISCSKQVNELSLVPKFPPNNHSRKRHSFTFKCGLSPQWWRDAAFCMTTLICFWEQFAHNSLKATKMPPRTDKDPYLAKSTPFLCLFPGCHLPCESVFCVCSPGQGRSMLCIWQSREVKVSPKETINHYHG